MTQNRKQLFWKNSHLTVVHYDVANVLGTFCLIQRITDVVDEHNFHIHSKEQASLSYIIPSIIFFFPLLISFYALFLLTILSFLKRFMHVVTNDKIQVFPIWFLWFFSLDSLTVKNVNISILKMVPHIILYIFISLWKASEISFLLTGKSFSSILTIQFTLQNFSAHRLKVKESLNS